MRRHNRSGFGRRGAKTGLYGAALSVTLLSNGQCRREKIFDSRNGFVWSAVRGSYTAKASVAAPQTRCKPGRGLNAANPGRQNTGRAKLDLKKTDIRCRSRVPRPFRRDWKKVLRPSLGKRSLPLPVPHNLMLNVTNNIHSEVPDERPLRQVGGSRTTSLPRPAGPAFGGRRE